MGWSLSSEALKNEIYNGIAEKKTKYSCTFFPSWFLEEFNTGSLIHSLFNSDYKSKPKM